MTDRFVGIGGNDGNSGLTWALRKLTLNGVEDTPIVAGDTVYVGPGTYRETLTWDVDGAGGSLITYIGDVTGENTDGVGGVVRITGSDNDQSPNRNYCVDINGKDYRTFRGFRMDMGNLGGMLSASSISNLVVEDCVLLEHDNYGIRISGAINVDNIIIRRSFFSGSDGVSIDLTAAYAGSGNLLENCIIMAGGYNQAAVTVDRCDGVTVKNTLLLGFDYAILADSLNANGYTLTVNNCILRAGRYGFYADAVGGITEDYNAISGFQTDRTNTNTGGNSNTYRPLLATPLLLDGFRLPWWFGELSEWSQVAAIAGTGEATDDLLGITRPTTSAKKSWGGVQFSDAERETGTTHGASAASIVFHDAGRKQIFVPVTNVETTIEVYVYREANYAGNLPQMIVKQPGQADDVTTDANAASQWNLLTTTFTPAATTDFVVVELVSRNTAVALAYEVFFDDLEVS